jgi:hypothetical protein
LIFTVVGSRAKAMETIEILVDYCILCEYTYSTYGRYEGRGGVVIEFCSLEKLERERDEKVAVVFVCGLLYAAQCYL